MRQHSNSSIGSCPLPGNRALHSALISPTARSSSDCTQPVLLDMGACTTGIVATFSPGGKAAKHLYTELNTLGSIMTRDDAPFGRVRAVVYGKGAHCPTEAVPLSGWLHSGQAHCFQGPNVGARESHTIWQFVAEFYDHLPRVTLFVQDDPEIGPIREMQRMPRWIEQLESSVEERAAVGGSLRHQNQPWSPTPCGCRLIREKFSRDSYGGYSPIHWWVRSFLVPYANGSVELPSQISWPSMAQFMMPRTALRRRSRRFAELNVRLTEVPAPLKANVPRNPKENDAAHHRSSKWANFGPQIVDFGEPPRPTPPGAWGDTRPGINGMDFAQLYERSWFLAFDPALEEHAPGPAHPSCLSRESIARSPMRCAAPACPYPHGRAKSNDDEGGCASSDEIGATRAPPRWRFAPSKTAARVPPDGNPEYHEIRCLGAGCLTTGEEGGRAWAATRAASSSSSTAVAPVSLLPFLLPAAYLLPNSTRAQRSRTHMHVQQGLSTSNRAELQAEVAINEALIGQVAEPVARAYLNARLQHFKWHHGLSNPFGDEPQLPVVPKAAESVAALRAFSQRSQKVRRHRRRLQSVRGRN